MKSTCHITEQLTQTLSQMITTYQGEDDFTAMFDSMGELADDTGKQAMQNFKRDFGFYIKSLRHKANERRFIVARQIGVMYDFLRAVEEGQQLLNPTQFIQFCQFIGKNPNQVLDNFMDFLTGNKSDNMRVTE